MLLSAFLCSETAEGFSLIPLSLLAWAATASAECAWMLWAEARTPSGDTTTVVSASETKQACERSLKEILVRAEANQAYLVRKHTSEVLVPGSITRYICLPDTVDPRGPKGK